MGSKHRRPRPKRLFTSLVLACMIATILPTSAAFAADETTIVDQDGSVGYWPSLELSESGERVISYIDRTNNQLKLARCADALCANPTIVVVATGGEPAYTSLRLDSQGNPIIAFSEFEKQTIKIAICTDPFCSSPVIRALDDDGRFGGSGSSLALDANDYPVVAYMETGDHDDLRLARCTDPLCLGVVVTDVATEGHVGAYASLELDTGDNPVIAYQDFSNGDLALAVCADHFCEQPTLRTVHASDDRVGVRISLELDAGDHPVISYRNYTNGDILLARCQDPSCFESTRTLIEDVPTSQENFDTSLELNADNNPVITYYDVSHRGTDVAVCLDPLCSNTVINIVDNPPGQNGGSHDLELDENDHPVVATLHTLWGDLRLTVCDDMFCAPPPTCDGLEVTIDMNTNGGNGVGTAGPDVILGTAGADVIQADDGNDVICAGGGDDQINAGSGDDAIFAGWGDDVVDGGLGDDEVWGSEGNDVLAGGDGTDILRGDGGHDEMTGGPGDDELFGGWGNDRVTGGAGNDLISGNVSLDTPVAGPTTGPTALNDDLADRDTLTGGAGEDRLWGGPDSDRISGGGGDDGLYGEGGDDRLNGGAGTDRCDGGLGSDNAAACETTINVP